MKTNRFFLFLFIMLTSFVSVSASDEGVVDPQFTAGGQWLIVQESQFERPIQLQLDAAIDKIETRYRDMGFFNVDAKACKVLDRDGNPSYRIFYKVIGGSSTVVIDGNDPVNIVQNEQVQ